MVTRGFRWHIESIDKTEHTVLEILEDFRRQNSGRGCHGEREPITGVWGRSPQMGPAAQMRQTPAAESY